MTEMLHCLRRGRTLLLEVAGTTQCTGCQRLQIFKGHFHGVALHDVFHGQNHAEAVFVPHHNAFET